MEVAGDNLSILKEETSMSLPLISYHINGNLKSEGLSKTGLIESKTFKGNVGIRLTDFGVLILKIFKEK